MPGRSPSLDARDETNGRTKTVNKNNEPHQHANSDRSATLSEGEMMSALPPMTVVPDVVPGRLMPALSALSEDANLLLCRVDGKRNLGEVVGSSELSKEEALAMAFRLLEQGILVVREDASARAPESTQGGVGSVAATVAMLASSEGSATMPSRPVSAHDRQGDTEGQSVEGKDLGVAQDEEEAHRPGDHRIEAQGEPRDGNEDARPQADQRAPDGSDHGSDQGLAPFRDAGESTGQAATPEGSETEVHARRGLTGADAREDLASTAALAASAGGDAHRDGAALVQDGEAAERQPDSSTSDTVEVSSGGAERQDVVTQGSEGDVGEESAWTARDEEIFAEGDAWATKPTDDGAMDADEDKVRAPLDPETRKGLLATMWLLVIGFSLLGVFLYITWFVQPRPLPLSGASLGSDPGSEEVVDGLEASGAGQGGVNTPQNDAPQDGAGEGSSRGVDAAQGAEAGADEAPSDEGEQEAGVEAAASDKEPAAEAKAQEPDKGQAAKAADEGQGASTRTAPAVRETAPTKKAEPRRRAAPNRRVSRGARADSGSASGEGPAKAPASKAPAPVEMAPPSE